MLTIPSGVSNSSNTTRAVVAEKHLLLRESGAFHEEIVHEPLFLPRKALNGEIPRSGEVLQGFVARLYGKEADGIVRQPLSHDRGICIMRKME